MPTGITQNVKDLLRSPEIANILENSDFIYMLNQASDDRSILAQRLNISPHQLSYVTNSGEGEGLLFYGNVILPFIDRFPTDLELYRMLIMWTMTRTMGTIRSLRTTMKIAPSMKMIMNLCKQDRLDAWGSLRVAFT